MGQGPIDDLLDVRAAITAVRSGAGGARHIASRASAFPNETVSHDSANLAIGDSATLTYEHWISLWLM